MFNSNFITKLVTTLAILPISMGGVPEAKAADCVNGSNYTMCFEMTGRSGSLNRWTVQVNNKYTTETMDVTCNGKFVNTWRSYGGFSEGEARQLAGIFCSL